MKSLAVLLRLLVAVAVSNAGLDDGGNPRQCEYKRSLEPRPHSVSILEFGAVGDGKTLNTIAFQNAIFYLKSFADKGGAQLYVPKGRWLTGSFNLTSHLTLFLEKDAVILGSQDCSHWEIVEPLSSYGRGIELPGRRYGSLITGVNLSDVVITGDNGTINGQGSIWWEKLNSHFLNYSRPHLVEFISCNDVTISNLTFINPPAWAIHPVYCSGVDVHNVTAHAPSDSPYTSGIVPDSSEFICIEECNISMGYDAISLKSGWDEYGISYGKPTSNVHIRYVHLQSRFGSSLSFGSEMSGGISDIITENLELRSSATGIAIRTARGRGGYIQDICISNVTMDNVHTAIEATGQWDFHPDDGFDPRAVPVVDRILLHNIMGVNITTSGNFSGLPDSPFTSICLSDIYFSITYKGSSTWLCSDISGFSENVAPQPCPSLRNHSSSPACLTYKGITRHASFFW